MNYKNELEEALDHIQSLQEALSWVGGDAYEVVCVGNMTDGISDFMLKHRPQPEDIDIGFPDKRMGRYALRNDLDVIVYAHNKRHAKNLLEVGLRQVICINPPSFV